MILRVAAAALFWATLSLPTAAFAQSAPDASDTQEAPAWVSSQATDPAGTRTCSVYPLRSGAFPMIFFYGTESGAELSIEGARNTPLDLLLQVDANPELDGGFPTMSAKNTALLIKQIRAGGRNLRLSQTMMVDHKLERFYLDLALAGAAEQLDKCRAWLRR